MYTSTVAVVVVIQSRVYVCECVCGVCVCEVERFTSDVSFGPGDDKIPAAATVVHLHPPNRKHDDDNIIVINILSRNHLFTWQWWWHSGSKPQIVAAVSLRLRFSLQNVGLASLFIIYLFVFVSEFFFIFVREAMGV